MEKSGIGQIMALVGLILLLLSGLGRQQARRQQQPSSPKPQQWQRWGNIAGLVLVLVGLFLWGWAK